MSWSLNEIEGLARKATRGAGLSWGLAEDAGRATRWLCAMGLPGADELASVLTEIDGVAYTEIAPQSLGNPWRAPGGTLCPLVAGACLTDMAGALADGEPITLGRTAHPLLLYPYLAAAADMTGTSLALEWDGTTITRADATSFLDSDGPDTEVAEKVRAGIAGAPTGRPARRAWRGEISADTAQILQGLAHRTYAPETEQSRLAGAGAGLTDND